MKTILLPTDFSNTAWNAIEYASKLYAKIPCRYILLNAFNIPPAAIDVIGVSDVSTLEKKSREFLQKELFAIKGLNHHPESTFEVISKYGSIITIVKKIVKAEPIDIVVMGTTGASGLREVLMGSNTVSVIKSASIPVLCVPANKQYTEPAHILLAADYKHIKNEDILAPLMSIAHSFGSKISILHVTAEEDKYAISEEESEEAFNLHNYIEELDHDFYAEKSASIEMAVEEFASAKSVDLVVVLKRKHSLLSRLFNFSVSKKMAFHSELPLLILPEK